jgi:hypothetical protein
MSAKQDAPAHMLVSHICVMIFANMTHRRTYGV